ncbi:Transposase [Sphingobium yanoikuyae]|nr:Transposase [Sphingobium yanoikuyae]
MQLEDILRQINTKYIDGHHSSPSTAGCTTMLRGGRAVHPISWRKEYGGLKTDQARRMKDLEKENQRLRRAISDLTLDKLILQEAARGNF